MVKKIEHLEQVNRNLKEELEQQTEVQELDKFHEQIKSLNAKLETNNSNKQEEDYKLSSVPNVDATTTTKTKRRYNI